MADITTRMARILTMIPYVRKHSGVRVEELAEYLGCSADTVLADLDEVIMCGVPPYLPSDYIGVYVDGGRVSIRFADHFERPLNLTLREALSLKVALQSLPSSRGVAARLAGRVDEMLPLGTKQSVREAAGRIRVRTGPRALRQKIRRIEQAASESRELRIEYYTASRDALTKRTVQPFALVEHQGFWYMVGHCRLRERELPFRVDRIRSLRQLRTKFVVPPDFDLAKYQRDEMYFPSKRDVRVRLWVHGDIARWVREEVPARRAQRAPGGHLILTVSVSRPEWILRWALRQGAKVRILDPPCVREQMRELAQAVLRVYD